MLLGWGFKDSLPAFDMQPDEDTWSDNGGQENNRKHRDRLECIHSRKTQATVIEKPTMIIPSDRLKWSALASKFLRTAEDPQGYISKKRNAYFPKPLRATIPVLCHTSLQTSVQLNKWAMQKVLHRTSPKQPL